MFKPRWNLRRLVLVLSTGGAAFTTASLAAVMLELAGLWKKMAPHQDPLREQGAPAWAWWALVAVSLLLWLYPLLRWLRELDFKAAVRRISWIAPAAMIVAVAAALLHAARFDPVPSKYYGVPGFVVGRESPDEYGTYYAMAGALAAAALGLCALIAAFTGNRRRGKSTNEKQATGG